MKLTLHIFQVPWFGVTLLRWLQLRRASGSGDSARLALVMEQEQFKDSPRYAGGYG